MATQLLSLGINVDCYPVLDILFDGADKVIGDRAFGRDPQKITDLARAATEGLLSCGVIPIIKHIPGHGRADVDSHKDLPIVKTALSELKETDFIPFKNLSDLPCAMTAHVIYEDIDPKKCATISSKVIKKIIRKEIGFNGVLFSDDVTMKALKSGSAKNATEALKAGCDLVIHCNAPLKEREEVLLATKKYMINSDSWIWSKFKGRSIPREIDHDKLYAWLLSVVDGY
jgi:beta-N-acetylhexosaminidase